MNELEDLLDLAKSEGQNVNKVLILGEVPFDMAELLSEQSGISVEHYKFSIDVYAIKHILKNHGIPEIEIPKGQIAITDTDFELIQDVLENPDLVFYDGKNKLGKDVFQFQKMIGDKYIVIKEVRTKKKQLALNSMRIIKKNRHL